MDNNVKIILGDGNVLDAVGISYIHIDASNKDYIFYSLNELANGNMDKIYIAEASQNGTAPGPISDEEWDNIKKIMLNISHNEPVTGITYKPLIGLSFNVGEAKKLAIKGDKKQAFIDAQNKAIAPNANVDEPAFVSDQAANGNPFFASDVNAEGAQVVEHPETIVPSAFAMNPPVEQEIPVESLETDASKPIIQTIIQPAEQPAPVAQEAPAVPVEQSAPVVEQPIVNQVIEQPVVEQVVAPPVQSVLEDIPAITPPQPVVPAEPVVNEVTQPVLNTIPTGQINISSINNIDELKQAIVEVQDAINKINEYISSVENKPNTVVVNTTQVQTIATGQAPVATESMNIAEQPELKTDNLVEETVLSETTPGIDTTPGFVGTPAVQENEMLINTGVETNEVLNTSVSSTLNEEVNIAPSPVAPVAPVEQAAQPVAAPSEVVEEPAFTVGTEQPSAPAIDLNATQVISTPNSAADINSSIVEVAIPEAPVIDTSVPQIPISPLEANGIPTVSPIQTVQPVETISTAPVQPTQIVQPVQPAVPQQEQAVVPQPAPAAAPQQTLVQTVPEIGGVQQVPIVDLSSINTDVTLPTDMVANPNPNTQQQGILGPATLDAQTDIAA